MAGLAIAPEDQCVIRLAQTRRRLDEGVEHRLQIEGRAADDLEHVGGGGLLLQRFAQIVCALLARLNSRTFSIAITAWSAKVVTSSICLSVNGRTVLRCNTMTPIGMPSRNSGTLSIVRMPPILAASDIL